MARGQEIGRKILYWEEVPRAMDLARQAVREAAEAGEAFPSGVIFWAGSLTRARGRFRRAWVAPHGGLWLAIVLYPDLAPELFGLVSLACGVALTELARDYRLMATVRWVNDCLVGEKKLAGCLIEECPTEEGSYLILGLGINVNNPLPAWLASEATSFREILQCRVDLEELLARLLAKLSWNIGLAREYQAQLEQEDHPCSPLIDSFKRLTSSLGRRVIYGENVLEAPLFEGMTRDIDPLGALILELDDGTRLSLPSGEIRYID